MKKIFLVLTILFVSVLTTACINNFAIQELNNKAKAYLDAGEIDKAICRYKSSLDLDAGVLETNYNLGVAYISAKNYQEALNLFENVIKIDSEFADTYYSKAVALENIAYDTINGVNNKTDSNITIDAQSQKVQIAKLNDESKKEISQLFMDAVDNYNHYLALNPNAQDKDSVSARVEELNKELVKYTPVLTEEANKD